jgi:Trm5-related predicted tRNA methylase
LTNGKPSHELTAVFEAVSHKFDRKIDRGAKFKFMWLNTQTEKKWAEFFKYNGENKVIVLNPGKRRRYT